MKQILITGANGQLGNEFRCIAENNGKYQFTFTDIQELDICNRDAVTGYIAEHKFDYIINCAAYTAVDKAEDEPELCRRINRDAIENLGIASAKQNTRLFHISTDYVYTGSNYQPYRETEETAPSSVYGQTKLEGELALLNVAPESVIIRTSWLYSAYGNNFVKTMLRLGKEKESLNVIFDQIGTPTYAADLADAIMQIIDRSEQKDFVSGVYNYSNEGVCSWYDFTKAIHKIAGITTCQVYPIESKDFPAKAKRPFYSVLNKQKIKSTFALQIPYWETSLENCIKKLTGE